MKFEDIEKKTFKKKYDQCKPLSMLIGLHYTSKISDFIANVFYACMDLFVMMYIDDHLIFSTYGKRDNMALKMVTCWLRDNKLYAFSRKCRSPKNRLPVLACLLIKIALR